MTLADRLLAALAPWRAAPAWRVAFSGGLDSTVLLHLLAELRAREALPPLSAIHVAHGLQVAAEPWPEHCRAVCARLGVELRVVPVAVARDVASLEQSAREARYAAFRDNLAAGEVLLTGQHRDDQAETLLFRLLRGAGVRGLAGMAANRPLGAGHLVRPLLGVARAELEAHARNHGLSWVEDPSNADTRFARNYLRQRVMPLLAAQWPGASASLARAAEHCREADLLLGELAEQDLAPAREPSPWPWLNVPSLRLEPLLALSEVRQRNALRHWLAPLTRLPDSEHWAGWTHLRDAAGDRTPRWRLEGGELQRGAGRLWWLAGDWLNRPQLDVAFAGGACELPGNGRVCWQGDLPPGALRLACRRGGERLTLAGRGSRDLKRLLNESGLPIFVRDRLPLLLRGRELLAVANLPALRAAGVEGQLLWDCPNDAARV
jgi:tRNA(Ile)-lysidine synthase